MYYKRIPVLTYHKVSPQKEFGITTVHPELFKRHMEYLFEQRFQTVTTEVYRSENVPENPIVLSFDDAYENIYTHAFPIMQSFGFKGLVFVINNYIGKENVWDANIGGIRFPHLRQHQISEVLQHGWEIGSHTLNHQSFLKVQDLEKEIQESKYSLEQVFQTKINAFSYPFGTVTKKSLKLVEKTYDYAFVASPKLSYSCHQIPRSSVYKTDGILEIKKKINCNRLELLKLKCIHLGAKATEIGQTLKLI